MKIIGHILIYKFNLIQIGQENYDNQKKFGGETFAELEDLNENGLYIKGIHHQIEVVCCCDWKAGACLEGKMDLKFFDLIFSFLQL